jgi:hypothetical protein
MKIIESIVRWWWWLWTGYPSLDSKRHAIEEEARRFGGEVRWQTTERDFPRTDDLR